MPALIRFALYRRVSTEMQVARDLSLPEQAAQQRDHVLRQGGVIIAEYEDGGLSGSSAESRPAFQEMIAAARRGAFDVILVHKSDRAFRNRDEASAYRLLTQKIGVRWASVTESFFGSPEPTDKLLQGIMESVSEFYLDNLRAEVKKGIRSAAIHKGHQHGVVPYGYQWADRAQKGAGWRVDEAEAERVRYIFACFEAQSPSFAGLCRHLNALGWPSPGSQERGLAERGLPTGRGAGVGGWHSNTVQKILASRVYVGEIKMGGGLLPGTHAHLIDRAQFDRVQAKLGGRAAGRSESAEAVFSGGMLRCPHCQARGLDTPLHVHHVGPVARKDGTVRERSLAYRCAHRDIVRYCQSVGMAGETTDLRLLRRRRKYGTVVRLPGEEGGEAWACPGYQITEPAALKLVLQACDVAVALSGGDCPAPSPLRLAPAAVSRVALLREFSELPQERTNCDTLFTKGRISLERYDELVSSYVAREESLVALLAAADAPAAAAPISSVYLTRASDALRNAALTKLQARDILRECFSCIIPDATKTMVHFVRLGP